MFVIVLTIIYNTSSVMCSSMNNKYVHDNYKMNSNDIYKLDKLNNYKLRTYENKKLVIDTSVEGNDNLHDKANDKILQNTNYHDNDELQDSEDTLDSDYIDNSEEYNKEKIRTELDNYSINDNSITVNVIGNKVYKKRIIHDNNNNEIPTFNPSLFTNKDNEIIMILNDNHKDLIIKGNNNPSTMLIGKIVSGMVIYIGLNFLFLMIYFIVRIISLIYCEKPIPDFEILL
ncbi:hypothetical protein ABK040_000837 [Willaertia magna]